MNDITKKRGGARPGAGRKPLPPEEQKVPIGYKIAPEAAQALDDLAVRWGCSKREALERALLEAKDR